MDPYARTLPGASVLPPHDQKSAEPFTVSTAMGELAKNVAELEQTADAVEKALSPVIRSIPMPPSDRITEPQLRGSSDLPRTLDEFNQRLANVRSRLMGFIMRLEL